MSLEISKGHEKRVWGAVGTIGLATAAVFSPWEGAKIFGMMTLTGMIYGIAKNMISYLDCPGYFNTETLYDPLADNESTFLESHQNLRSHAQCSRLGDSRDMAYQCPCGHYFSSHVADGFFGAWL